MIIDIFTHVFPPEVYRRVEKISPNFGSMGPRVKNMRQLYEFDDRFRLMDEAGDYVQIISLGSPTIEEVAGPKEGAEIARAANDSMAELTRRHPDRFPGFVASLAMNDMDAAMREVDRSIDQLGARGVQVFTDVAGKPLDAPEFDPVFAELARRGLPVWLHPTRLPDQADFPTESESLYDLWLILGWPYATAATMIRLVLAGLFERHPGLKVITHHMGGMIPFHEERIAGALYRLSREPAKAETGQGTYMRRPPMEMMKMFYADTAMHGAVEATRCGLSFFGANNVVFATDCPFGSIRKGLDMVEKLGLDETARNKLFQENAERLMRGAGARRAEAA